MTNARDLSNQLAELLRREHVAMADFLVALADFDAKRRWVELGYSSLWYFLHRELGVSKGAATFRKTAAELVQRYPEIIEPLRDGRLCLSTVVELARVITPENRAEVLPRFFHRSKQEAKAVAREVNPIEAPPRRDVVTTVTPRFSLAPAEPLRLSRSPVRTPCEPRLDLAQAVHPDELDQPRVHLDEPRRRIEEETLPEPTPSLGPQERDRIDPMTPTLSRLHVTVSRRFLDKVDAARDALSHQHPGGTLEQILEAGLDLVLAQHAKRKGLVEKPRKEPPPSTTDHIPAHVKREVWRRDGGKCQYPLPNGDVCGSTRKLEFHHRHARGLGGPPTTGNVTLHCRFHNLLEARRDFGDGLMNGYARDPRKPELVREPVARYGAAPCAESPREGLSRAARPAMLRAPCRPTRSNPRPTPRSRTSSPSSRRPPSSPWAPGS
jgi:hypothetical protein